MLPIYLSQPSEEPARRRTAARLIRHPGPTPSDRAALARDRAGAARRLEALARDFERALADRGVTVTRAATAADAAARIAALAGSLPVAVTRAAVIAELQPALAARSVRTVPTYGPGAAPFTGQVRRFWQLPAHERSPNWSMAPEPDEAAARKNLAGLFGVNAASAASGAIYLLQHSRNIGDLLRTAAVRIFIVGLDKLADDDGAARRQVEAVGQYGADSILLDLSRTTPLGAPLEAFSESPGAPAIEVILLDNGRAALRGGAYESLLTCIGCRACATRCPTYPEFRGPRGWSPKDYLWSHIRGDNPTLELCTFCGNCEVDCPVDIPLPTMIGRRRAEDIATRGRGIAGWRRRTHGEVERLGSLFSATAPLSAYAPRLPLAPVVMEKVFGLAPERPLPEFRRETLERWGRATGKGAAAPAARRPGVVYYFGCFANFNDPGVGQAMIAVMERLGYDVILPPWKCCGIPLYAKGEIEAARRMVEFNLEALGRHIEAGYEVVTSCPSCQMALERDYPRLFPSAAAERVSAHTRFFSRFLRDEHALEGAFDGLAAPQRAAYHLPCHLRALGMEEDTPAVLGHVPGLSVHNIGRGCCGLSGTFGIERDHYAQSMDVGAGVFAAVKEGAFDMVLTDCGACKLQIEHGTGRAVTHPLEVLSRTVRSGAAHIPAARRAAGAAA